MEWSGVEWSGVEWSGVEWSGVEWSGVEWSGVEWSGVEWSGVEWSGGRDTKESEYIHIPGIDVGGGWRTGWGSHPQSAERVEEREESVWSVVRRGNEREDQGEGVQNSGKTISDVRGRDMGVEEGTRKEMGGRRDETATMDVRSYEAGQDQK